MIEDVDFHANFLGGMSSISRPISGGDPLNRAKPDASNMTPRKATMKRFRCHFENGSRSRCVSSSAGLSALF
jgi:hypothetical protein